MGKRLNFDDIRPYHDSEVNLHVNLLLKDPNFQWILKLLFQDEHKIEKAKQFLSGITSIKELQKKFMYSLVEKFVLSRTTQGVSCSGLSNFDASKSYLFISNHRDIILDAAIMNYLIFREGMNTTEIAIGDNLFIDDWIVHAVKLNRAFAVKRNLQGREFLTESKRLSAYIRQDIVRKNVSIWIAQREGRTKDGCDKTNPAILKMLNFSNKKTFAQGFKELRIVPLSISYEIEPCGISKVEELYKKETEGYTKTQADDLKSMAYGLMNPKGKIHFSFGKPMDVAIDVMDQREQLSEKIEALADYIDQRIYKNYKFWPNNFIAADLLRKSHQYRDEYTDEQLAKFENMLDEAVSVISGDDARIKEMFLTMYANPVINRENLTNPDGYF